MRSRPTPALRDRCYFDGRCGFCRRTTRWLRRLDWLGRLEFVDLTPLSSTDLPVPLEVALRGMPMRTRDGRVLVGFPAIRRAALQTPCGALPALIAYLPGISHALAPLYDVVARRRRREACNLASETP